MHELRNKLYDEGVEYTPRELAILNFESDFNRTYKDVYNNEALDDFLDSLQVRRKAENLISKNADFFKDLYKETGLVLTSDRELTVLWIIYEENWYWLKL